jgi:hypothetical protein
MKKFHAIICILLIAISFCSCSSLFGDTSKVNIKYVESEIYSDKDIESAIDITLNYFRLNFQGCTLKEIYYAGDNYLDEFEHWKKQYDADETIVLLSTFDVDSSGGDGSLKPNDTYKGWNWILVRNKGGQWEYKDHGY